MTSYPISAMSWIVYIVILNLARHISTTPVNVAMNKPIWAPNNTTCGSYGPEDYREHKDMDRRVGQQNILKCNSSRQFPATNMVDGDLATHWQSTARYILIEKTPKKDSTESEQYTIVIDMMQEFEVLSITLAMGDSRRPGRIAISKSSDGVAPYQPWVYRVTKQKDCTKVYKMPITNVPQTPNSVICDVYGSSELPSSEKVEFIFDNVPKTNAAWRNARYIRFEFYDMAFPLGVLGYNFLHYTVTEVTVMAECVCNGLAKDCQPNNGTGRYQCVCGGNTAGISCQKCAPFFNQFPYLYGTDCQPCNCNDHATECYYDATVANYSLSLNDAGLRQGGGVCINCTANTTGNNCEKCTPYHYRPKDVSQTTASPCVPCQCDGPGILIYPGASQGDCLMNNDTIAQLGMEPGDCYCKANVMGPTCDKCKPGFYNLSALHSDGCLDCGCSVEGSTSVGCETAIHGQCPCKEYVTSIRCDQCMDNYYGLSANLTKGCLACDCDVGGSYTPVCEKVTGQCPCRWNVTTRQCTQTSPGFYYADPHFLAGEFEQIETNLGRETPGFMGFGYASLRTVNMTGVTSIAIPARGQLSGSYQLLLRYQAATAATAQVTVTAKEGVSTQEVAFPAAKEWTYLKVEPVENTTWAQGQTLTVSVALLDENPLLMDRAVLLPTEFANPVVPLGENADKFTRTCDVINNDMQTGKTDETFCETQLFSLSTYYLDGALPCDCHPLGSDVNKTCATSGGKCECQPGVMGRRCDQCVMEYFNLTADGCQPCNCETTNKVCDMETGQCLCPPNARGRQCELCDVNHWNWTSQYGCLPCSCDPQGSVDLQCNETTGICECKTGVSGDKCSECADEYKNFSPTGCVPCACAMEGSTNATCNKTTGQCPCKDNTQGMLCTECKAGSFYLSASHEKGCLECVCMGVTSTCKSSTLKYQEMAIPITPPTTTTAGVTSEKFRVSTEDQSLPPTVNTLTYDGAGSITIKKVGSQPRLYLVPLQDLKGNLVAMFEHYIAFDVIYTSTEPIGQILLHNKVIIFGRNGSRFDLPVASVDIDNKTTVRALVTNENLAGDQENITRGEFMLGLSDVNMVLLPISYYDRIHVTSLSDIKYYQATDSGTGDPALGVEQCTCGPEYTGLSCERCVAGYTRQDAATQGYLGTCVPCDCHQHATHCHQDTGLCQDCQHNTIGDQCELCMDGYHGDATAGTPSDCSACPCYSPRVTNTTCNRTESGSLQCLKCAEGYKGPLCNQCDQFYYGNPEQLFTGTCQLCYCNGNAETCDPKTGACVNCNYNTTGHTCHVCTPGFYGNASMQTCQPCACDMSGSTGAICDAETGQCPCQTNVGTRTCSACLPDYYGYSDTSFVGCVPCNCNAFGSVITQCAETGLCNCSVNVQGNKCDACTTNYWGLPNSACAPCDCDKTGTVDPALPCESVSGQCGCKPGIDGRQCEKCQFMYTGFSTTGCTPCGDCAFSLGNDTAKVKTMFHTYWNASVTVQEVQEQDMVLIQKADEISATQASLGVSTDQMGSIKQAASNLTQAEATYKQAMDGLLKRVDSLEVACGLLENRSREEVERLQAFRDDADAAFNISAITFTDTKVILNTVAGYNSSAYDLLSLGKSTSIEINVNFDAQKAKVTSALVNMTAAAASAKTFKEDRIQPQANVTSILANKTAQAEAEVNVLNVTASGNAAQIDALQTGPVAQAKQDFNYTLHHREYSSQTYNESSISVDLSETLLTQCRDSFVSADQDYKDVQTILHGGEVGQPLPVTTSVNLQGLTSWEAGADLLPINLNTTWEVVNAAKTRLTGGETTATALTTQAQTLQAEFTRVQPLGQQAVDAIQKYEAVVQQLATSLTMATKANQTIQGALQEMAGITADDLKAQAVTSLARSLTLNASLTRIGPNAEVLTVGYTKLIDSANASLLAAISTWDQSSTWSSFYVKVDKLNKLQEDPQVKQYILPGKVTADATRRSSETLVAEDNTLRSQIATESSLSTQIQTTVTQATTLQAKLKTQLNDFQNLFGNKVQRDLTVTQGIQNQTKAKADDLDKRFAALEAKLNAAFLKLQTLDQPVSFDVGDHEVMNVNPAAGKMLVHHEIMLEFRHAGLTANGVLLYMESNVTSQFLALHMIQGTLLFSFNNGDQTIDIPSKAALCGGCWFKVIATRYGIEGHLVVIKMTTGGFSTDFRRGNTATSRITITSPIYVGGFPSTFNTTRIPEPTSHFTGCMYNARVDGVLLPLWSTMFTQNSTAKCCQRPQQIRTEPATIKAVGLNGFGYMELEKGNLSFVTQSHMSLRLRTLDEEGVALIIAQAGRLQYYGLFVVAGKFLFEYGTSTQKVSLQTAKPYNDGEWYQVTIMHNATYAMLYVQYVNASVSQAMEVVSQSVTARDLSPIADGVFTLGGQNPATTSFGRYRGPVTDSFAGCVNGFSHSIGTDYTLVPYDITAANIKKSVSVNLNFCYEKVVPGLGFATVTSYAKLVHEVPPAILTLELDLITYSPSGILVFGKPQTTTTPWFYVALYNGDVFVMYDQGSGLQPVLRTRGLFLSDGNAHKIHIDFSMKNNPRLTVNGAIHNGNVELVPSMFVGDNGLYVGGVPSTVSLNDVLPVRNSIVGGIQNILINERPIDMYNSAVLLSANQDGAYTSGLPEPPGTVAPPPYTTTPAPPTTPQPTCTTPGATSGYLADGVRFGDAVESYISYTPSYFGSMLQASFTLTLEFRAVQSDGIILYAADTENSNPSYYFCLFLKKGKLMFSMDTNSPRSGTTQTSDGGYAPGRTKLVTLKKNNYNNGKWVEVTVLRINDFVAMVVTQPWKDYINNAVPSNLFSRLTILTPLYIGGLPAGIRGLPFTDPHGVPSGKKNFRGCIKKLSITTESMTDPFSFDLMTPSVATGNSSCFAEVVDGVFMNQTDGYAQLATSTDGDLFNVAPPFNISITMRPTSTNATLVAVWQSSAAYLLIDIYNGRFRAMLSSAGREPFTPVTVMTSPNVCDKSFHTLTFVYTTTGVTFVMDAGKPEIYALPLIFTPTVMTNVPIYIGGIQDSSWTFGASTHGESFRGCIRDIVINTVSYKMLDSSNHRGMLASCPV